MTPEKLKQFHNLRNEFAYITNIQIPYDITGIDIIKLDELIQTPDNVSMADHLTNKYGERATAIVEELIDGSYIFI